MRKSLIFRWLLVLFLSLSAVLIGLEVSRIMDYNFPVTLLVSLTPSLTVYLIGFYLLLWRRRECG